MRYSAAAMSRLFALPAGRRSKWVVLGAWLVAVVAILGFQLPSKYADAEKNESTSFLPGDAESTEALAVTDRLQDGEQAPTVIVYQRDGGLTAQDKSKLQADLGRLNALGFANTTKFGNPAGPDAPGAAQLSADGSTALIANSITANGESENILDPVDAYRDLVSDPGGGLQVKVGGPAGVSADAIKIFESINGTLLLSALALVFVLLILIYRSPFFWFFTFFVVLISELTARGFGYGLTEIGVTVNGQSSSITSIIVLGAGTDYALLLVARYREELRKHEDKHEAMAIALRSAGPAILASGLTVAATLLSLTLAKVNGTAGLGPSGAMGIVTALLAQLTLLPALLVVVGRKPFWPFVPRFGEGSGTDATHGVWRRVGERIAVSPRRVWIGTTLVLAIMSLGVLNFSTGLTQGNSFRDSVEAIEAQNLIAKAFPAGQSAPMDVVVRDPDKDDAVAAAVAKVPGVAEVRPTGVRDAEAVLLAAFLEPDPYSTDAFDIVPDVRSAARSADATALIGGASAVEADLRDAATDDTLLLVPLALVIVFVILMLLLRAIILSLLLMATVILSFLASLGVAALVYDVVFGFPGSDPSLPLFALIFLVALGVDYNIFLMARVREEVPRFGTGPGTLRGLAVTGSVITSAGIVLAGTFAILGVLPITFLTEIGFVVAFGVLLDTFVVRSILVPALVLDVGSRVWWPSSLADVADRPEAEEGTGATLPSPLQEQH